MCLTNVYIFFFFPLGAVFISTLAVEVVHKSHQESDELEMLTGTIQPVIAFMVLCSITIHGLSIPSFSLGRRVHSVSRTWSRSATLQSEWMNQTSVVRRPEDIVVNRDDPRALEEGRAGRPVIVHPHRQDSQGSDSEKQGIQQSDIGVDPRLVVVEVQSRPASIRGGVDGGSIHGSMLGISAVDVGSSGGDSTTAGSSEGPSQKRVDEGGEEELATPTAPVERPPPVPLVLRENVAAHEGSYETQWDEGSHRVIERRGASNEDVSRLLIFSPLPPPLSLLWARIYGVNSNGTRF